ncbi:hypothetical protein Afil01_08930 [Actinorhabdospora filicis]|uniref:Major facilitator superfamily (MFS) profile domain-containing protein n=1 Tax=Actinorhabdospora filicis TaxID=1785913 RepID=A0A9W6W837_9ACTN|nr:hypothetical protein [Actinorhabdospora filicis]GLZ76086.1 hypothetical protein Afil01_08930 [Actinorhabdospora filicis]
MTNLDSLFSAASLLSLQGATAAALLVPNVLGNLLGEVYDRWRKWTSLGIAMVLAYLAAFLATDANAIKWVLAFFNGCLIFASAMGLNQLPRKNRPNGQSEAAPTPKLFKSWI